MTESRERYIENRQELYRHPEQKPRTVWCCKCGMAGEPRNMGLVGDGVYKCWMCLAGIKEEA